MNLTAQILGLFLFCQYALSHAHVVDIHLRVPEEEKEMERIEKDRKNEIDHALVHDVDKPDDERWEAFVRLVDDEEIV